MLRRLLNAGAIMVVALSVVSVMAVAGWAVLHPSTLPSLPTIGGSPTPDRMRTDADRLAAVLPVLEGLRVVEFRNQDWCRQFAFHGGRYSEADEGTTCMMLAGDGDPFDDRAERAFAGVAAALRETGVAVYWVSVEYDDDGSVIGARFDFDVVELPPFREYAYVYSLAQPDMRQYGDDVDTPINGNWHLVSSDWM